MFRGTASYYARFRPGYPSELLDRLARAADLDGTGRLLDLACGTGQLAIPLAAHVAEVLAVDREPGMLAELRKSAPPNVRTRQAHAEDVDETWGRFRLVTVGRAFHWFDGPVVLDHLARVTRQVALVGDPAESSEAWRTVLETAHELLGERPAMRDPDVRYEQALAASAFSQVEVLSVEVERTWTVDQLIGVSYSTSFASLERLGGRKEQFERLLRERLQPFYRERVVVEAVLGRRGDERLEP